jgi:hypothetical protein
VHLPLDFSGEFELVSGDLTYRYRQYLAWLTFGPLVLQWLLAYHFLGVERPGVFLLLPFVILLLCVYGFSDEFRATTLVNDYRPLMLSLALFEAASWLAVFLPWIQAAVVSGIALFLVLFGLMLTLATARPPMRYPMLVLEAWRLLFRRPETLSPEEVDSQLPEALMLLRSFPMDTKPIEYVDMEFLDKRILFTATLEDTIRLFASRNKLKLIKLGGESRSEGAAMVLSDDRYWQQVAFHIINETPAILVVPSSTPGLAWEVEQLVRSGWFESKVSVVFPNVPGEELGVIWSSFCALVAQFGIVLPLIPPEREWQPLVARFDGRGRFVAVASSRWTTASCRRAYWYALQRCVRLSTR